MVVYQYDFNNNLINVFPSANEAARQLGKKYGQGNISRACSGGTAYGFIWNYRHTQDSRIFC